MVQKKPKKKVGKKVAAAPLAVKKVEVKKEVNPLFEKRSRNFGIDDDILDMIVENTNKIISTAKYPVSNRTAQVTDKIELKALLGLLYLQGKELADSLLKNHKLTVVEP
ncbi:hypothetical protein NQ314_013214 [Rhamnusium bicolor]|uniref:Uncharacterized protein n=1 Tax=Rhamnusium bicolor TaxID=1586634 RepID=A0AAV8X7Z3_9CUCU|nr:hypothetical protein NQ314_013214 [Rhamnusium bicolor]